MSFQSLNHLLLKLQQQPAWESYRQYQCLMEAWVKIVEPDLLPQTKPLAIRRQILWVAVATPVLAQTLTLQRYQFLKQLNNYLETPLQNIRYSTVNWHLGKKSSHFLDVTSDDFTLNNFEPNYYQNGDLETSNQDDANENHLPPQSALEAFERWANLVQNRRSQLPLCPRCEGPTRPQELERWSMCSTCIRRTWQS